MVKDVLLISLGGAVGAVLRYFVNTAISKYASNFPFGVLTVNVIGSFLIGVIFAYISSVSYEMKIFLIVGFLGAFTTFSAFSLDNLTMLQAGRYFTCAMNTLLNVGLSLGAVVLGYFLFR